MTLVDEIFIPKTVADFENNPTRIDKLSGYRLGWLRKSGHGFRDYKWIYCKGGLAFALTQDFDSQDDWHRFVDLAKQHDFPDDM